MKIEMAEHVRTAGRADQLIRGGYPEVAFVGRSNVGKSSLMNKLISRKGLARTSSTPGRTQTINYFLVNGRFHFVDLPGYGFAKASKSDRQRWAELVESYLNHSRERLLLVQLVDGKVGATALDEQAQEYFHSLELRSLIVATKIDKVPRTRRVRHLKEIRQRLLLSDSEDVIPFSAVSGDGVKELWKAILSFLEQGGRNQTTSGTR